MRDNKHWYEKWYYITGLVVSILAISRVCYGVWNNYRENSLAYNPTNPSYPEITSNLQSSDSIPFERELVPVENASILYLSEEYIEEHSTKKIVYDNIDYILRQKKEKENNSITMNSTIKFIVFEEAAKVYYFNQERELRKYSAGGKGIPFATVLLLDYETDQIIQELTTNGEGFTNTYSFLDNKVYCIAYAANYNIYVSGPIILTESDYTEDGHLESDKMYFYLLKENDEYSSLFQIATKDVNNNNIINKEIIVGYTLESNQYAPNFVYFYKTNEFSCISDGSDWLFFELNNRYLLEVALNWYKKHEVINASSMSTNSVTVQFDYEQ